MIENKMGTTIGYWGYIRVILGVFWDNGKENGNYYEIRAPGSQAKEGMGGSAYDEDLGGCQNFGPFLGPHYNLGYPKRDHNFDNHPFCSQSKDSAMSLAMSRPLPLSRGFILLLRAYCSILMAREPVEHQLSRICCSSLLYASKYTNNTNVGS